MSQLTDLANQPLQTQILPPIVQQGSAQVAADTQNLPNQFMAGVDTEKGFLTPGAAGRQGAALGGPDSTNAVLSALGIRNERHADDFVNNMKQGNELMAPVTRSAGYAQQAQNTAAMGAVQMHNYKILKQQQMNQLRVQVFEKQQEQSLIAGILGVIGTIGGAVIGGVLGGPAGAVAGSAGGGAVGRLAGGGH